MNERAQIYKILCDRWEQVYKDKPLDEILAEMVDGDNLLKSPEDSDFAKIEGMAKRLRELTRWIPVEERLPTKEDSDWNGMVAWKHRIMYGGVWVGRWDESPEWHGKNLRTHWKRIENL